MYIPNNKTDLAKPLLSKPMKVFHSYLIRAGVAVSPKIVKFDFLPQKISV